MIAGILTVRRNLREDQGIEFPGKGARRRHGWQQSWKGGGMN